MDATQRPFAFAPNAHDVFIIFHFGLGKNALNRDQATNLNKLASKVVYGKFYNVSGQSG